MNRDDLIHRELSEQIIGAAMKVLNTLGPGLSEKIYENALVIELTRMGLRVDQQEEYRVEYLGSEVGRLKPDLLVENKVIVDTKVVENFNDEHIAKMISYLAITKLLEAHRANRRSSGTWRGGRTKMRPADDTRLGSEHFVYAENDFDRGLRGLPRMGQFISFVSIRAYPRHPRSKGILSKTAL